VNVRINFDIYLLQGFAAKPIIRDRDAVTSFEFVKKSLDVSVSLISQTRFLNIMAKRERHGGGDEHIFAPFRKRARYFRHLNGLPIAYETATTTAPVRPASTAQ
jgi:hypothetical protein